MSDIPPSLEKVCDRLSPTFEDGGNSRDLQRKCVSSALDYLQRSGRKKRKVEEVKPEESSRKSSRQRTEKGPKGPTSKPTPKAKSESKNVKTKAESISKASKRGESKSASPTTQQQHWDSLGDGVPHNVGAYRIGDSIQRHHMGDPMIRIVLISCKLIQWAWP
jgi:hypothetical protein